MTVKEKYNINGEVEFQDVELNTDTKLFVDPYLIYLSNTEIGKRCSNDIVAYFDILLNYAKLGDRGNGYRIVKYLQENNEVRLGYSLGKPLGRGLGNNKGKELFDTLCKSKAIKSGLVADIFDASIMLDKIGYDRISDLTINIIFEELLSFTYNQCIKHCIPMEKVKLRRPLWSSTVKKWMDVKEAELPIHNGNPIVLIPYEFTHTNLVYTYSRFYEAQMMQYYEREVSRDASSGLVKILKRGPVPSRTKIRKAFPCLKGNVINFIENNPEEYKYYKDKQLKYVRIDNFLN